MRLIDADALDRSFSVAGAANEDSYTDGVLLILGRIEDAPTVDAEYVAKRDVIALLKKYAHRCIDAGRLTLDVVDDTAALTCLVEAMPAARYEKEEDDKA